MKKSTPHIAVYFALSLFLPALIFAQVETLRTDYKRAKTEMEKLEICIHAINKGVISRGASVTNIDQLFGTDYSRRLPTRGQPAKSGVIDFADQPPAPLAAGVAAARTGWYLAFEFDHQGSVESYYLSNLHK